MTSRSRTTSTSRKKASTMPSRRPKARPPKKPPNTPNKPRSRPKRLAPSPKAKNEFESLASNARRQKGRTTRGVAGAKPRTNKPHYTISPLKNTVVVGDSLEKLDLMPEDSADLAFTSSPYYNARPQYAQYQTYAAYLGFIRAIFGKVRRVLVPGRFFVINISHVLVPRNSRKESSTRLAIPFDFHRLLIEEGFEFIDDIIWKKPEGAGWATGRGRRFAADRNPLQYKTVPVTEYVLVYRKKSNRLIDFFIRNHPNQELVKQSKIEDGYEKTNIWSIHPAHSNKHPAIFPLELAEKVIRYYSFVNDVVLDPFAGIGTVGEASIKTGRRYYLIEKHRRYISEFSERQRARNNVHNR